MQIKTHKNFDKAFLKLPFNIQKKVKDTLETFKKNPHESQLNNHALHGKDQDKRAISAGGDLRIVFLKEDNYGIVTLLRVGNHNQVYS